MPRGGGGGGFRGGGFSGGFRGSSFRGSAGSFRVGSIRSSGRPFGRTGAIRTVSRPSGGPYRHNYYRPRSSYWGWYGHRYRPWYWRWWHYPRFWGYYHRPWYYSPVYVGGGIILLIVLPLIILPLLGVSFYYPFSGGISGDGNVSYRSSETLYFNEYWYEYENVDEGSIIDYTIQSTPGIVDFIIWKGNFENIPIGSIPPVNILDTIVVDTNQIIYEWTFLKPGAQIQYNFTADAPIEFFIADTDNIIKWNDDQSAVLQEHKVDVLDASGSYSIPTAGDYYAVWYNEDDPSISVDIDITYDGLQGFNFTGIPVSDYVYEEGIDYVDDTFTVPEDGTWYFFVYFDPFKLPEETMDITFDVTFGLGEQGNIDAWKEANPWLIFFGVVAAVLVIMAVVNRRKQKEFKTTKSDAPGTSTTTQSQTVIVKQDSATDTCPRCNNPMKSADIYCKKCGEKREGRRVGTHTSVPRHDTCEYCGANLRPGAKFCTSCGSHVE